MGRVTNQKLSEELYYIKGKIEAGDIFAKEHREWEVIEIQKIENHLSSQNNRIRKSENVINWFKGIGAVIVFAIGWLFNK